MSERFPNQYPHSIRELRPPFELLHALEVIGETYGAKCYYKDKSLAKYGRYANLGTSFETIQEHGGNETFLTDNLIDVVVSSDAGDNQLVSIEGHTIDGSGNLTFKVQEVTLNGTTNVPLTTPLARATRIVNKGATNFAGTVKVVDASFPTTIYVQAGYSAAAPYNRSQKCSTSVSEADYWIITKVFGDVLKKTAASADFSLQVGEIGGALNERYGFTANSTAPSVPHNLAVPIIIPADSDVRLAAKASTTGVEVVGRISGYLAKVI